MWTFQWVLREYGLHAFLCVLFLFNGDWWMLLLNVPLLGYHIRRYVWLCVAIIFVSDVVSRIVLYCSPVSVKIQNRVFCQVAKSQRRWRVVVSTRGQTKDNSWHTCYQHLGCWQNNICQHYFDLPLLEWWYLWLRFYNRDAVSTYTVHDCTSWAWWMYSLPWSAAQKS